MEAHPPILTLYNSLSQQLDGGRSLTENLAGAFTTTGDKCLDFFATVVRDTSVKDAIDGFLAAWNEDPDKTIKLILSLRDIRNGKGEKKLPLLLMYLLSCWKPLTYLANFHNFIKVGCYKDLLVIAELAVRCANIPHCGRLEQLGNDLELSVMAAQLNQDDRDLEANGKAGISLCAKWAPSEMRHYSKKPLYFSRKISRSIGLKKSQYRKKLSKLRQHLRVLEGLMCNGKYEEIVFSSLPAKAHRQYRNAFKRGANVKKEASEGRRKLAHRYANYLADLSVGKETIKSRGTQPHELVVPYMASQAEVDATIEGQWKALVGELAKSGNFKKCQAVCDVSGSMEGVPMQVAVALGLLVSELTEEPFRGQLITFHQNPKLHKIKGHNLKERVEDVISMEWGGNTDLLKVFDLLLRTVAEEPAAKMVEKLFIFTDMQFDAALGGQWSTTYEQICQKYAAAQTKVPQIIFWNLRATAKSFPVMKEQAGTALVSGFSAQLLKVFMEASHFHPLMIMNLTLDKYDITPVPQAERYPIAADASWESSFRQVNKMVQDFLLPKTRRQQKKENDGRDAGQSDSDSPMDDQQEGQP
ncbi:hypothetical protein RvY_03415 [Ramazzottius varieornatus]|uniref:TROVE domain-containing protein n=1 Tax=Ramazzottius varieornatus TaxID=947166 RepID=A0A1D1UN13_RAMVA|nr:hypothetical protein RvY_03415 [Ramazzottius varieornatus]